ncbi:RagB/SusD family nutrient uptake outer membrane protein, partial [Bacteroides cellulosilyticus]|nr:RagB/SusD family nutrient uptake outer membrane protein [Bacteroides cellulosilyticus]
KEYISYIPNSMGGGAGYGDYRIVTPSKIFGNAMSSVTLDLIDEYRMADGRAFSEDTPEEKSGNAVGQDATFSGDYRLSGLRAHRDNGREPRFYATTGFNGCVWP